MQSDITLGLLGLGPRWVLREAAKAEPAEVPLEPTVPASAEAQLPDDLAATSPIAPDPASAFVAGRALDAHLGDTLEEVATLVSACQQCALHQQRHCAVAGVGGHAAEWLIVGEAPGAEEDAKGEPFVGQAGKLLDAMLAALGLVRGAGVYITNAVKCRPPNNRTPEPDEIDACFPYLRRQIELIKPRIIVALGRPAAQALLKQEVRIGAARGKLFRFDAIPVVVTYHPAYLLRNPEEKFKAWEDFCFAREALRDQPARAE
ncbi:uracil-DNA glycosylase [Niveibacterium sp. 24ML]|uniref:uracil-DNA glycosylase n=1 Tax=Niveibacterium sp. 24ML TaxID=2985512 RepID=UPI0022717A13|nr:uracil-DNA glycosylase [Niveibacterium sp. 24ML]MCX9157094.1 uracil-DNA glycosylase [Niveibacterium sp. 24ML]